MSWNRVGNSIFFIGLVLLVFAAIIGSASEPSASSIPVAIGAFAVVCMILGGWLWSRPVSVTSAQPAPLSQQPSRFKLLAGIAVLALLLAALGSTLASWSATTAPTLRGREIPPLPAGCTQTGGGMLGTGFAYAFVSCDGEQVVVLERSLGRRGKEPRFQVLDQVAVPVLEDGHSILNVMLCESPAYKDSPVFGIGRWKEQADGSFIAEQISHAWRFDLQHGKIEAIAPQELKCEAEAVD